MAQISQFVLVFCCLLCFSIPAFASYEDGSISVGEVYGNQISFQTAAYNIYRLPYGISYKQLKADVSSNTINCAITHTPCPSGNCGSTQNATYHMLQLSLDSLEVLKLAKMPISPDSNMLSQRQYAPITIDGVSYYITNERGFATGIYGVDDATVLTVTSTGVDGRVESAFGSAALKKLYLFSTPHVVGHYVISAVDLTTGIVSATSETTYFPSGGAVSHDLNTLFIVGDDAQQNFGHAINHTYFLTSATSDELVPSGARFSLTGYLPKGDNIVGVFFEPGFPDMLYIASQNQTVFNVNDISVRKMTIIQVNVADRLNPVVLANLTIAHNGYATGYTFDSNRNLYYMTTAANIIRIPLANMTSSATAFSIMTLYERAPPEDSASTLMTFDVVSITNGTLYTGATWWGMLASLPLKDFCDDNDECFLDLYTNYIVIYVVAGAVAALFIITLTVGIVMHVRARRDESYNSLS